MKLKEQINQLVKKLSKMIYILRNLNKVLELSTLCQVYFALVESLISHDCLGGGHLTIQYPNYKFKNYPQQSPKVSY